MASPDDIEYIPYNFMFIRQREGYLSDRVGIDFGTVDVKPDAILDFAPYDTDEDGTISREELTVVIMEVSKLSRPPSGMASTSPMRA